METEDIKIEPELLQPKEIDSPSENMELDETLRTEVKTEPEPEEKMIAECSSTSEDILKTLMDTDDSPTLEESVPAKVGETSENSADQGNNSNVENNNNNSTDLNQGKLKESIETNDNEKHDESMDTANDSRGNIDENIVSLHHNSEPKIEQNDFQSVDDANNDFDKNISKKHTVQDQQNNTKDEIENALSALASAAINHGKETEIKSEPTEPKDPKEIWHTVGFIKGTSFNVQNYFYLDESEHDFTEDGLPDVSILPKINLEPGTAYKFRVAAINSVGKSDWSEISAFKTCVPGFPSAPSAIKIAKSVDGAHISWEPPKGEITEYSVYLAVKNNAKENVAPASMAFVRVYSGANNSCVVPHTSLASAYVDTTTKSAIIFRIAARNEKGYGPATQVRWLQDSTNKSVKRPTDEGQMLLKKTRNE